MPDQSVKPKPDDIHAAYEQLRHEHAELQHKYDKLVDVIIKLYPLAEKAVELDQGMDLLYRIHLDQKPEIDAALERDIAVREGQLKGTVKAAAKRTEKTAASWELARELNTRLAAEHPHKGDRCRIIEREIVERGLAPLTYSTLLHGLRNKG